MDMITYLEYFTITLFVSGFFAMGGVGAAVALVPIFDFLGLGFNLAKTIALFINTSTTITASIMNLKRGVLDIRFAYPLVISSLFFAPIGAKSSEDIDLIYIKFGFVFFLIFSATMILFSKKEAKVEYTKKMDFLYNRFNYGLYIWIIGCWWWSIGDAFTYNVGV